MEKGERVRRYGEVFTPRPVVERMLDLLEEQAEEDPFRPETTFLEPSCGDGAFVVAILRRKFRRCRTRADYTAALASVYGIEIQADNVEACIANVERLCQEHFRLTRRERTLISDHIIQGDALKIMKLLRDKESLRLTEGDEHETADQGPGGPGRGGGHPGPERLHRAAGAGEAGAGG